MFLWFLNRIGECIEFHFKKYRLLTGKAKNKSLFKIGKTKERNRFSNVSCIKISTVFRDCIDANSIGKIVNPIEYNIPVSNKNAIFEDKKRKMLWIEYNGTFILLHDNSADLNFLGCKLDIGKTNMLRNYDGLMMDNENGIIWYCFNHYYTITIARADRQIKLP